MQRLHIEDWSSVVLKEGFAHLLIRQEYDPDRPGTPTPIGWVDPRTEPDELLFPARFPASNLAKEKARLGSEGYAGQHQQDPVPAGGGRFKSDWFRRWTMPVPGVLRLAAKDGTTKLVQLADCRIFTTADFAQSEKTSADYTVFSTWAVTPASDLILLDLVRGRMPDPDIVPAMHNIMVRWRPSYFAVESNGIGLGIIQTARRAGLPVQGIPSTRDKVARASTAVIRCEAGQVYFPAQAHWLLDFESELLNFPQGHDDQVDTVSLAAIDVFWRGGADEPDDVREARLAAEAEARSEAWHSPENDSFFNH